MNDVQTLLSRCRELGAEFTPTAEGKLKVWAPAPLPEELQAELRRRKAEVVAALTASQTPSCRCGSTTDVWQVNRDTCWAQWVCRQCQGKVAMPTRHLCNPSLPLSAPCNGREPQKVEGWLCRQCGQPAEIEDIMPSLDGQRMLTLWKCRACLVWGATRDTLREPPVWVSRIMQ